MLTPQEIDFLYQLLDQVNLRGEEQKQTALTIMRKLRQMAQAPPLEDKDAEGD